MFWNRFNANIIAFIIFFIELDQIYGHGRLIDPPSRSSAWRFGFKTAINYNDNELFCGGFTNQWKVNGGKCGVCGDSFNGKRDNEVPNGRYTKPLMITRTYRTGQRIEAKVQLTANHNGFFVFKLCPTINDSTEVSQQCLDTFPLEVLNSSTSDKYIVPTIRAETFTIALKLPNGLNCSRCVFQWTYTSGNNWGQCEDGSSAVGCGPQETFRGCADVRVSDQQMDNKSTVIETTQTTPKYIFSSNSHKYYTNSRPNSSTIIPKTYETINKTQRSRRRCKSTGIWMRVPNMDDWCHTNCAANYCPKSHCICENNS